MRTLSANAVRAVLAQHSDEVFLVLLTISHPSMTTLRVVANTQNVVSGGNTYTAFPFQIDLPADLAEELRGARLRFSNVDQRLIDEIRLIPDPVKVEFQIVTASSPGTVEVGPFEFETNSITYDAQWITATLTYKPILFQGFPKRTFNPREFPSLFGRL